MTDLFGHSIRSELLALYLAEALVSFVAIYALFTWGFGQISTVHALSLAAGLALCSGLLSGIGGLYQPETLSRTGRLLAGTAVASAVLLLLALPAFGLLGSPLAAPGQHTWPAFAAVLVFSLAVITTRLGFLAALRRGLFRHRLVLVRDATGTPPVIGERHDPFEVALSVTAAATISAEWLRSQRVWGLVAADPAAIPPVVRARCNEAQVRIFDAAEFRERRLNRVDIDTLPPGWLERARKGQDGPLEAGIRRGFDILLSLLLLAVTLPLTLATALAIKLDSPGPVFYRQERVGRGGRVFTLYKFRSMVVDAERGGARWASKGDPRVTRIGRIIRLARIDEIPQVLNVLKGDMAFVGPRPERPGFVTELREIIPHYDDRAVVKPGITGWAQVNYPYGASVEDARMKLAYDLYYIRRRSLFLDLLILIGTIRVVLFQEGAR